MRDPDQRDPHQRDSGLGLAHPEAAGWVLGTLDPHDAEWFAGHLPQCPDCEAAVAELGPTARLLATATSGELLAAAPPEELPPPGLQAQTLAAVAQAASAAAPPDAAQSDAAQSDAAPAETIRARRWPGWSARMLALAAAVVIAAGTSIGLLLSGGTSAESYTLQLHSGPGQSATGQSATASGTMRQAASGWSVQLTAKHLPVPGPGQFYQCWWVGPGNRPGHPRLVSAGTFTASRSGAATMQMWTAADPDDFSAVEITLDSATQPGQPGRVVLSGTVAGDS